VDVVKNLVLLLLTIAVISKSRLLNIGFDKEELDDVLILLKYTTTNDQ